MERKDYGVGACGKACFGCMYYDKKCLGCFAEMKADPKLDCAFYNCVDKKKVTHCLQCPEYPCDLHKSIKELCPIYRKKIRGTK